MVTANDRWEMSKSNESVHDFWIRTFDFYLFAIDCKDKFRQLHGFLIVSVLPQAIFFHDPFKKNKTLLFDGLTVEIQTTFFVMQMTDGSCVNN